MVGQNETIENKAVYMCNIEENCFSIKKNETEEKPRNKSKKVTRKKNGETKSKNKKEQPNLA